MACSLITLMFIINIIRLKSMLASLKRQGFKLIINGGDVFVSETLKDGSAKKLYDGVNQEDVFTTYDFNKKKYGRQIKKYGLLRKIP